MVAVRQIEAAGGPRPDLSVLLTGPEILRRGGVYAPVEAAFLGRDTFKSNPYVLISRMREGGKDAVAARHTLLLPETLSSEGVTLEATFTKRAETPELVGECAFLREDQMIALHARGIKAALKVDPMSFYGDHYWTGYEVGEKYEVRFVDKDMNSVQFPEDLGEPAPTQTFQPFEQLERTEDPAVLHIQLVHLPPLP